MSLSGLIAKVRVGGGTLSGVATRFSDSRDIKVLKVATYTPMVEAQLSREYLIAFSEPLIVPSRPVTDRYGAKIPVKILYGR